LYYNTNILITLVYIQYKHIISVELSIYLTPFGGLEGQVCS